MKVSEMKTEKDALQMLDKLMNCIKFVKAFPCTKMIDGKACESQDIPFSSFCDRCKQAWNMSGELDGMSGEEAFKSTEVA